MQHLDDGRLQAWLDRERSGLDAAEIEAIEVHLDACDECAARAEELEGLTGRASALLAQSGSEEALPAYRAVVLRAGSLHRSGARRRRTASAWAASVAVALGAGWLGNELYRSGAVSLERPPLESVAEPGAAPARGDDVREPGAVPTPADAGASAGATGEAVGARQEAVALETQNAVERSIAPTASESRGTSAPAVAAPPPARVSARSSRVDEPPPPAPVTPTRSASPAPAAAVPAPASGSSTPPSTAAGVSLPESERGPLVRGRVVDAQTGQPIPAAQVYIADIDVGVLTQSDGSFELPLLEQDVDEGPLTLTVERIGYRRERREFSADPGDVVVMDFRVQEEALALDEIVVTGTPGGTQRRAVGGAVAAAPALPSDDPDLERAGGWSPIDPARAATAVGFPIALVPSLDVTSVEIGQVGGAPAVRIRQALGPDGSLTLLQARAPLALEAPTSADGRTASVTEREGVTIVGIAALPADSLSALLARVR